MGRKSAATSTFSESLHTVLELGEIPEAARAHLRLVYLALGLTFLCSVAGAAVVIALIPGLPPLLPTLACLALIFAIQCDQDKENVPRRMSLLAAFGFIMGASIAPLVHLAIAIDPSIVLAALLCACSIFGCFSLAALVAKRRSFLFLGGLLSSALTMLLILNVVGIFIPALRLIWLHIYGGLILFSGFVVYDTQVVIEKAAAGSTDFAGHALMLFLDFVNIFVKILIIFLRNRKNGGSGGGGSGSSAPLLPTHRGEL